MKYALILLVPILAVAAFAAPPPGATPPGANAELPPSTTPYPLSGYPEPFPPPFDTITVHPWGYGPFVPDTQCNVWCDDERGRGHKGPPPYYGPIGSNPPVYVGVSKIGNLWVLQFSTWDDATQSWQPYGMACTPVR